MFSISCLLLELLYKRCHFHFYQPISHKRRSLPFLAVAQPANHKQRSLMSESSKCGRLAMLFMNFHHRCVPTLQRVLPLSGHKPQQTHNYADARCVNGTRLLYVANRVSLNTIHRHTPINGVHLLDLQLAK